MDWKKTTEGWTIGDNPDIDQSPGLKQRPVPEGMMRFRIIIPIDVPVDRTQKLEYSRMIAPYLNVLHLEEVLGSASKGDCKEFQGIDGRDADLVDRMESAYPYNPEGGCSMTRKSWQFLQTSATPRSWCE